MNNTCFSVNALHIYLFQTKVVTSSFVFPPLHFLIPSSPYFLIPKIATPVVSLPLPAVVGIAISGFTGPNNVERHIWTKEEAQQGNGKRGEKEEKEGSSYLVQGVLYQ
jgi:hypothetical protein